MSNQPVPYPIRMPDELRDVLAERARMAGRSLHAEIISILQAAADDRPTTPGIDINAIADAVAARVIAELKAG